MIKFPAAAWANGEKVTMSASTIGAHHAITGAWQLFVTCVRHDDEATLRNIHFHICSEKNVANNPDVVHLYENMDASKPPLTSALISQPQLGRLMKFKGLCYLSCLDDGVRILADFLWNKREVCISTTRRSAC